jgi:hypothetical protein
VGDGAGQVVGNLAVGEFRHEQAPPGVAAARQHAGRLAGGHGDGHHVRFGRRLGDEALHVRWCRGALGAVVHEVGEQLGPPRQRLLEAPPGVPLQTDDGDHGEDRPEQRHRRQQCPPQRPRAEGVPRVRHRVTPAKDGA